MFEQQKKYTSEAIEEDKPNIWSTIEKFGKGFFGEKFMEEWGKGSKGDIGGTDIEGLSILDKLFSNVNIPTTLFKQGGMVKKYEEGGSAEEEGNVISGMYDEGNIWNIGDIHTVKEGGTYQKWVWKTDPWTGVRFKEKKSFPYYAEYTRNSDGTLNRTRSNIKSNGTPRGVKTKQQLEAMVSQADITAAGTYLEEGTGLYKKDKKMADLVQIAKGDDDDPETISALSQLAILARAQRPEMKDKSMPDIIAEIKEGLHLVNIDLTGENFQEIEDVYETKEKTLASTLTKSKNVLGETVAETYDPMISEREKRRKRETIGTELAEVYSTYGSGREQASRAYGEATETATGQEFSVLDTLFGESLTV